MVVVLCVLLVWVLLRNVTAMAAARAAAGLFVSSVMPGLFPYMVLALLLTSRLPGDAPEGLIVAMGWCGGSPAGAKLLAMRPDLPPSRRKCLAVTCATMSPMFLLGTIPQWTGSWISGVCLLVSMLAGAGLTGALAGRKRTGRGRIVDNDSGTKQLTLGEAVEQASRTMLTVCGTMLLLRVAAALAGELLAGLPAASLAAMTLLEVTSGTAALARLPLSLAVRTALIAAATGFGGAAIMLQNRASSPDGLLSLPEQMGWQVVHGLISGGVAYLLMRLMT